MVTPDWQTLAEAAISQRDAKIPKAYRLPADFEVPLDVSRLAFELPILTEREKEIVAVDGVELYEGVKARKWSCVEVTTGIVSF